ncbi:hypothetical protein H671_7g18020 [Cricetulus griseus]|nr:hypothetical protein H671_7g18020 [Cricetulus griseus]
MSLTPLFILWLLPHLDCTLGAAEQVCTPTNIGGVFLLLHIVSRISCHRVFDFSLSDQYKMVSQSGFDLHFLDV